MEQPTDSPVLGNMQPTAQGFAFVLATLMKKNGWTREQARRKIAEAAYRAGRQLAQEESNGNCIR